MRLRISCLAIMHPPCCAQGRDSAFSPGCIHGMVERGLSGYTREAPSRGAHIKVPLNARPAEGAPESAVCLVKLAGVLASDEYRSRRVVACAVAARHRSGCRQPT